MARSRAPLWTADVAGKADAADKDEADEQCQHACDETVRDRDRSGRRLSRGGHVRTPSVCALIGLCAWATRRQVSWLTGRRTSHLPSRSQWYSRGTRRATVAGAATELVPDGYAAPCSLLIRRAQAGLRNQRGCIVAPSGGGAVNLPWRSVLDQPMVRLWMRASTFSSSGSRRTRSAYRRKWHRRSGRPDSRRRRSGGDGTAAPAGSRTCRRWSRRCRHNPRRSRRARTGRRSAPRPRFTVMPRAGPPGVVVPARTAT